MQIFRGGRRPNKKRVGPVLRSIICLGLVWILPMHSQAQGFCQTAAAARPTNAGANNDAEDRAQDPASVPAVSPPQEEQSAESPANELRKLVGKKIKVHLRDGRVYKGKLLEFSQDWLRIQTRQGRQEIALGEITTVERLGRNWNLIGVVVAAAVVTFLVIGAVIANREG